MSISEFLNVVIGLVFTWLVLSLTAMYVQEWFATRLKWRSRMLETTIRNMFSDPALTDQLYNHPLIHSLFSGQDNAGKPSYIPSNQFALALIDLVMISGMEAALIQQHMYKLRKETAKLGKRRRGVALKRLNLIMELTRKVLIIDADESVVDDTLKTIKSEIDKFATDFPKLKPIVQAALIDIQKQKGQIDAAILAMQNQGAAYSNGSTLDRIQIGVTALGVTNPSLKQTLTLLLGRVEETTFQGESVLARAQKNIEDWFNNSMDRLSGWYKRRAQTLVSIIGLVLVILTNTDSLSLTNQLWRGSVLRDTLAYQAATTVNQDQNTIGSTIVRQLLQLQNQLLEENLPVGWIGASLPLNTKSEVSSSDGSVMKCVLSPQGANDIYGLPIAGQCYPLANTPRLSDSSGWILKILGLLVTALATAQGAPFWFDILKKIINIRSSGLNPAEIQNAVG